MDSSSFGEKEGSLNFGEIQTLYSNGATSDTFKVYMNGKWYFLKRPQKEFINHPLYTAAFEKEFDIGAEIDHPNIIRYVEKGNDVDGVFVLSEYIEGLTLKDFLETSPDYFHKKANLKKFIRQLLSALEYLHERQILHLDLKPENILITKIDSDVKIVDLGFAYTDSHQHQTSGRSERYAAPEQVISNDGIDQRADIYSFGLLALYAYTSSTNTSLVNKLPEPYRGCIRKCLIENKENRFETIISIREYLTRKNKQKSILYLSTFVIIILSVIGSMQYFFYKDNAPIDISQMNAPNDIMRKVGINTNLEYIKEHYGEPMDVYQIDSTLSIYSWNFKNLQLSASVNNETSIERIVYLLTTDNANLLYDDMMSGCEIPNLGKVTFGDYFNSYHYDGNTVTWGGDFCVDICFCEVEPNQITIVIGPNRITNFMTIELYSTKVGLLDINEALTSKIYREGMEGLNRAEKQHLFEEIKKLKIEGISYSYKESSLPLTPFRIEN